MDNNRLEVKGVEQTIKDNLFDKLSNLNNCPIYIPNIPIDYDVHSINRHSHNLTLAVGECSVATQARFTILRGCNHTISDLGDAMRVYIADMMLNRSICALRGNMAVDIWHVDSFTLVQRISWTRNCWLIRMAGSEICSKRLLRLS